MQKQLDAEAARKSDSPPSSEGPRIE